MTASATGFIIIGVIGSLIRETLYASLDRYDNMPLIILEQLDDYGNYLKLNE